MNEIPSSSSLILKDVEYLTDRLEMTICCLTESIAKNVAKVKLEELRFWINKAISIDENERPYIDK